MKIRELLQTEIWSKRTTRKILAVSGIVFGFLVLGIGVLYIVEVHWLSPPERKAGREALALIDELHDRFLSTSDEGFNATDKQAQQKVEIAKRAELTVRDEKVAIALDAYLVDIEAERSEIQQRELRQQRNIQVGTSEREFEEKLDSSGKAATQFLRSVLNKTLD